MNFKITNNKNQEINIKPIHQGKEFEWGALFNYAKWSPNTKYNQIYNRRTLIESGDRNPKIRKVKFEWVNANIDTLEFHKEANRLILFFDSFNAPFYLVDIDRNVQSEIALESYEPMSELDGDNRMVKHIFNVILLSGSWFDLTETVITRTFTQGTNNLFDINHRGNIDTLLTVEATSDVAGNDITKSLNSFSLINSTSKTGFRYEIEAPENLYTEHQILTADSQTGDFTLNGVNVQTSRVEGGVVVLKPSVNNMRVFQIYGGDRYIKITIRYRSEFSF